MSAIFSALKYMPASLARKALEKVNPGFGNFFAKAAAYGYDIDRSVNYIADTFQNDAQKQYKRNLQRDDLRPDQQVSRSQMNNQEAPIKAIGTAASYAAGGLIPEGSSNQSEPTNTSKTLEESETVDFLSKYPELEQFVQQKISEGQSPQAAAAIAKQSKRFQKDVKNIENTTKTDFIDLLQQIFGGQSQADLQLNQPQTGQNLPFSQPQANGQAALAEAIQAYMKLKGR